MKPAVTPQPSTGNKSGGVLTGEPMHLLFVSDIRLYRDGIQAVVSADSRVASVRTAKSIDHALNWLARQSFDVVLVDMAYDGALAAIRTVTQSLRRINVVVLADAENETGLIRCAEAGVVGFVSRDSDVEQLIDVLTRARAGEVMCSPKFAGTLFRRVAELSNPPLASVRVSPLSPGPAAPPAATEALTRRERQIAQLVGQAMSNKEIATRLNIELSTVKTHLHNLLQKLHATSRCQIVSMIHSKAI